MEAVMSTAQRLSLRTVHVKMYPTARSFQERREVLRVLERFGEVNVFRSLKYHPHAPVLNAFIAIFSSDSAAQALIDASPVRYRMFSRHAPIQDTAVELAAGSELTGVAVDASSVETSEGTTPQAGEERVFEINISKSGHDHERYIREQPMFGPWKPAPSSSSFMSTTLRELLPSSLMTSGLTDWTTASQKYRKEDIEEQMNIGQARNGDSFSIAFQEQEKHRKLFASELPRVMESLSDLSKEVRAGPKQDDKES